MKKYLYWLVPGISLIVFIIWTVLVKTVDVSFYNVGKLGFSNFNLEVNNWVQTLPTSKFDLMSTILLCVAIVTVFIYGLVGFIELIKRKSFKKVDSILYVLLGFYVLVTIFYAVFELYKVNYTPLSTLEDPKASYPSSHIFISISFMCSAMLVLFKYINLKKLIKGLIIVFVSLFCVAILLTRLMSGNHWFTDIIGGLLLSIFLVSLFMRVLKCFETKGLIKINE